MVVVPHRTFRLLQFPLRREIQLMMAVDCHSYAGSATVVRNKGLVKWRCVACHRLPSRLVARKVQPSRVRHSLHHHRRSRHSNGDDEPVHFGHCYTRPPSQTLGRLRKIAHRRSTVDWRQQEAVLKLAHVGAVFSPRQHFHRDYYACCRKETRMIGSRTTMVSDHSPLVPV